MSFWRFILSSLLILNLCACGYVNSDTPGNDVDLTNTINDIMVSLKNLDMDEFNEYTNNRQVMVTPWGDENVEYTLFGELYDERQINSNKEVVSQLDSEIVKNLSWEISDVVQNNNTAKLKLRITNLNMSGISERVKTDSEMINEIKKIPLDDTTTIELKLKAEKEDGKWMLLIDTDFANAISANIWIVNNVDFLSESSSYDVLENDYSVTASIDSPIINSSYTYEGVAKASKKQRIEIISADDDSTFVQITDLHEITDFLNQEEMDDWVIVERIPENAKPVLSIVRYALERKTINPQLQEQSRHLLYQVEDVYYIEDKTDYSYSNMPDYQFLRYYEISSSVGEYMRRFLQ